MASKTTSKKNVVAIKDNDIPAQIETLRADIATLTSMVKTQATDKIVQTKDTVKETAAQKTEAAKVRYDELTTQAEKSIKENPLTSIAIAVGAGIVLGALSRR